MNNEKIKELKKFIKVSAELGCYYKLANCEITMLEVFEYINELESENEQLKQLREVDYKTMTILRKANIELNECMGEMQDRIAELEKENENEKRV